MPFATISHATYFRGGGLIASNGKGSAGDRDDSLSSTEQALGDADQSLGERDQTLSDGDQTQSDRDQTLSDADQEAADDDHAAAERGGDVAEHDRIASERAERTREREVVSGRRDQTARERDAVADQRDATSSLRDQVAKAREEESEFAASTEALADAGAVDIDEVRARAAAARSRAAADRLRATRDRESAAADRAQAAEDRAQAAYDRKHAGTDELTGVRRRGVGLEELANEIARARRLAESLVAVYVDVDGLKAVNDAHGHPAGDKVLQAVADRLRGQMRSYDLIVRLGGDEFLCVLPGIPAAEVRERFALLKHPDDGSGAISVGLSELREGDGVQDLISRADDDLIRARPR